MPTHIKHNSSKIITIIITIMYTIDSITWTFCTISFKLAIGPNISKEFLRSIDLFSIQFQRTCDRSVQIFKEIGRSVHLKCYYCLESCDRLVRIFKGIGRSVQLKCYYCWASCDWPVQIFKGNGQSITKYNLQN